MTTQVVLSLTQAETCPWNFCLNSFEAAFHLCIVSLQNSVGIKVTARLNRTCSLLDLLICLRIEILFIWNFLFLWLSMIGFGALGYCCLTLTADSYLYSCIVLYQSQQDAYPSAIHVCALLYTTGHCFNRLARVNEQLTAENWHNMHLLSKPSRYLANLFYFWIK